MYSQDEESSTSTESSSLSSTQCFDFAGTISQETPEISSDKFKSGLFATSKNDFKVSDSLEEMQIPEEYNADIDSLRSFPEKFQDIDSYGSFPGKLNEYSDSYRSEIGDKYSENEISNPSLLENWTTLIGGSSESSSESSKSSKSTDSSDVSEKSDSNSSESVSESSDTNSSFSICSYSSYDSDSDLEDPSSLQHSILSYLTDPVGDSDIHWGNIVLSSSDFEDGESDDTKPDQSDFLEQEKDTRRMEIFQNGYKNLVHLVLASLAHDTSAKIEHQNWRCLIVDGIPEKNITTEEECKQFALYLFEKLNAQVKPSDIVRAFRLGPKGVNNVKMRPILLKFRHYEDKSTVFKKSHALGVGFRVSVKEPQIDYLVNLIKGVLSYLEPNDVKIMKSVEGFYSMQVKGDGKVTPKKLCKVTSLSDLQKLEDYLVVNKKKEMNKLESAALI